MSRPVYVLPEAEADLRDAQFWYDSRAFGLGDHFFSAIDDAVSRIGTSPLHFPLVHDTTRRALVRRFPYALYFRVEAEGVFVIACSHTSRRPSHWQGRV
ncbi:plasmid stabilization system protein ParE [Azospirillum agricola]|uniref:type II toxin-antitoxin system RelE/ParE family toxin n=1 Tax=Azospirillum agricola TaxID=1720247 RepID=UPI001AE38C0E|nr:type II toxin-antitoxin system RelE/ParE family toxin [Azospirillum agricola]MBP2230392.1 plasmid stabilization system protein ParE [Azospirillum agricola]